MTVEGKSNHLVISGNVTPFYEFSAVSSTIPLSNIAGSNDGSQFDNGVGPMRAHVFSPGIEYGGSLSVPSTLVLGGVIGSNLPFHVGFCEGEWW